MENFTPVTGLVGGALIGLSAAMVLFFTGRIAGISGILGGLLSPQKGDISWRLLFLGGLILGGVIVANVFPSQVDIQVDRSIPGLVLAGLLVGLGTRIGNGCTSGHGVCGIGRLAPRSIVASITFMTVAGITVYVVNHVMGGA